MIDKGICKQCGRKIQATVIDTCMYCGNPLAEEQLFSQNEKQAILDKQADQDIKRYEDRFNSPKVDLLDTYLGDIDFTDDFGGGV